MLEFNKFLLLQAIRDCELLQLGCLVSESVGFLVRIWGGLVVKCQSFDVLETPLLSFFQRVVLEHVQELLRLVPVRVSFLEHLAGKFDLSGVH